MLTAPFRTASLVLAAGGLALAAPASALPAAQGHAYADAAPVYGDMTYNHGKDRGRHRGWDKQDRRDYEESSGYRSNYQPQAYYDNGYQTNYGEPVYNNTRVVPSDLRQ